MKCDHCGLQSDVEQAFSQEKRLLRRTRYFCPDCTVKRHTTSLVTEFVIITGCGLLLYLLNPLSGVAAFYLQVAIALLSLTPLVILHELAHALMAGLLGMRVFGIMIGTGRAVWSGKFLGMNWTVNMVPIGGITFVGARPVMHIRWRLFFIYLAGPASHIFMALALYMLMQSTPDYLLADRVLRTLVFANIVLALANLFPRKVSVMTGMQGTDGWHLLRTPFLDERELTKQYIGNYGAEAMQAYTENDLDAAKAWVEKALALDGSSGVARNILGVIQMARREYRASRETFLQILETDAAKEPGLYNLLLNNVAYLDALLGDRSLLPEADQFSFEALKHLPWLPAVIGTRGTVLVELGQLEEGIATLKKSMAMHGDKQGKALNAGHIAIGELRRGDLNAARKYLATARTLDPKCFLLQDVEAQLASPVLQSPVNETGLQPFVPGNI
ncbi:MAG TPA: site-2 protease family protein [Anaerolineales bacterium]|nr:site-2 protease family protein [Anaerolineales bacterium]